MRGELEMRNIFTWAGMKTSAQASKLNTYTTFINSN